MFKEGSALFSTEIERREGEVVLYINYLGTGYAPNIADSSEVMRRTIEALAENSNVMRVVMVQQRNYNYPFEQINLLVEIAQLYNFFIKSEEIIFWNIAQSR